MNRKFFKIFSSVTAAAIISTTALPAFAQIGDVPTTNSALGTGGIPGTVINGTVDGTLAGITAENEACAIAENAFSTADHKIEFGFGGLSLIGGSAAEKVQLIAKIEALDKFILCRKAVALKLKAVPSPNLYTSQKKQRLEEDVNLASQTLKKRKDDVQAQYRIAERGFWKSLIVPVLVKTTRVVAERVVNNLTSRYKVNDFMRYTDAVASQVYTTQFIQNNARDNRDQMIVRSMITNPLARKQIQPAIIQRALDAVEMDGVPYDPMEVSLSDPQFYQKMTKVGFAEATPDLVKVALEDQAQQAQAEGLSAAQQEINQSSGLKAPRNCSGNVAQQQAIDQEHKALSKEAMDRLDLLESLKAAKKANFDLYVATATWQTKPAQLQQLEDDIKKAQADYDSVMAKLKAQPQKYESPVLTICEGIASPAELVNKGIDKAFGKITDKMGEYNENNLPFFSTFISEIGSQVTTSLIFGGNTKNKLLNEMQNVEEATGSAMAFAMSRGSENIAKGINFSANASGSGYILEWGLMDVTKYKDASYITISSNSPAGLPADAAGKRLPLEGKAQLNLTAPQQYLYTLKVYNKAGKELGAAYEEIEVKAVQGAYIQAAGPRGAEAAVAGPRGPWK